MAARSENTVKLKFIAEDKAKKEVSELERSLKDLNDSVSDIGKTQSFQFFDMIVAKVQELGRVINDIALSGASFNLLEEGFTQLASGIGESSESIINKLKEVSGNAISNRDLMLGVNKSLLLGIAENSDQMAQLLQIAIERADKLGISATQAFNDIVTGLGRQSALILDNLGIIVEIESVNKRYAESVGKTVLQLSDHEKKMALVNEVVATSQGLISGTTTETEEQSRQVQSLSAAWSNLYDNLSGSLAPLLADLFSSLGEYLNVLSRGIDSLRTITQTLSTDNLGFKAFAASFTTITEGLSTFGIETDYTNQLSKSLTHTLHELSDASSNTAASINPLSIEQELASKTAEILSTKEKEAAESAQILGETSKLAQSGLASLGLTATVASAQISDVTLALQSASQANAAFQSGVTALQSQIISQAKNLQKIYGTDLAKQLGANALEELSYSVSGLQNQLQEGKVSALDLALSFGNLETQLTQPFTELQDQHKAQEEAARKAAQETERAYTKSFNSVQQAAEAAFSNIESKVSGVLSESLNLGGLINLDDILPREDAVNENARRLADIAVKGYESPWVEYIKNEFPNLFSDNGDIKNQAAIILKDFQDGLVPELIDKETAKDRVRRALIGEQNMKDLATEIAQELSSEFGNVGFANIQQTANQALGLSSPKIEMETPDLDTVGASFTKGFKDSLSNLTSTVMSTLNDKLNAKELLESVMNSGKNNGNVWGSGFLETVGESIPARLIEILALAVLPNIEKLLSESSQRS